MRILIIPSWYPTPDKPVNGVFVRDQADALHNVHEVRVFYLDVLPRGHKRRTKRWVSIERGYVEEVVEVPNLPLLWQFTYLWYLVWEFRRISREFAPEIMHCHVAVPAGWGGAVLKKVFGVPVVLTEHSSEFQPWLRRPGLSRMAKLAFRGVNVVVAVSEGQLQRLRQKFKRVAPVVIVRNVVDTSQFSPTPLPSLDNGCKLLFVGLMDTNQKGLHVLLDALSVIKQHNELNVQLDVVGDGALRLTYEALGQALGLETMLTFHGLQSNAQVAQMLRQSHALVLPSLHEALPVVIIEALVSGRPVISTRCGGPEHMLDTTNGLIVEPGNTTELAEALKDLITNINRYDPHLIGSQARKLYSREAIVAALTDVYHIVLRT